jgi:hypothetical protein
MGASPAVAGGLVMLLASTETFSTAIAFLGLVLMTCARGLAVACLDDRRGPVSGNRADAAASSESREGAPLVTTLFRVWRLVGKGAPKGPFMRTGAQDGLSSSAGSGDTLDCGTGYSWRISLSARLSRVLCKLLLSADSDRSPCTTLGRLAARSSPESGEERFALASRSVK